MKKIISMISALAIAAASFTSMAFAATVPTMNVTAEKITDFSGDYAGYADYVDYGLDVYSVKFKGTGLSMTTRTSGLGGKFTTGDSIVGATMQFIFASTAVIDEEWVFERLESNTIGTPTVDTVEGDMYTCAVTGTKPLYPPAKTAKTVTTDEEILLEEIIFAVDPSQPVTLTFQNCAINVGTFNASTDADSTTTYKMGGANPLAMSAPTLTLPVEDSTPTYTITFKDYNGSDIQSNVYDENDPVSAPANPTRESFTFSHWSETEGGPAATVLTTATADKTYYAVYSAVAVASVSLNKANISLKGAGATETLVAAVLPSDAFDKDVTWSSSNTSVATVANGVVTAVAPGKAVITVTTEDGGKTATCNVVVNPAPVSGNKFKEIDKNAELRNLAGDDVRADNNYGVAKIDHTLDTANYDYKIVATDDKEETKEWTFAQGGLNVEFGGEVAVNFIAIVKSATHKIVDIALQAYTK